MSAPATDADYEVAYLGPEGSFSHLVARQRYAGTPHKLVPMRSVHEVFDYLEHHKKSKGIVPIENSSGGLIIPTIDGIIEHACDLFIEEELSLDVKLALLSKKGREIRHIYSHVAPLQHCEPYLRKIHPEAKSLPRDSTANAAKEAADDPFGAAIGPIDTAEIYGLDVLEYPLQEDVRNVTQFFLLSHERPLSARGEKTSLVVALPNYPGSLYDFLKPFADAKVNLSRIESRPVMGVPNTYNFLIEISGTAGNNPSVVQALVEAEKMCVRFNHVGSYPVLPRYQS